MVVTLTVDQLADALIGNQMVVNQVQSLSEPWADAMAARLLPTVTEMVNRYAPAAPPEIANQAAIRAAGHLAQQPADARTSESFNILGVEGEVGHATSAVSPLRASGAMALLSPYKVRRGGLV